MVYERKKIGLLYTHDENWIGGTYYILNLISALNKISDALKPFLIILIEKESDKVLIEETEYPYLKFKFGDPSYLFLERLVNVAYRYLFNKNFFEKRIKDLFPGSDGYSTELVSKSKLIYWIPDFQECYFPQFFSPELLDSRKKSHQKIASTNNRLIFSSENAKNDFIKFFPDYKCKLAVLKFAVQLPFLQLDHTAILKKNSITTPYFICSNQFWTHKNHRVLLDSALLLKNRGVTKFTIVLTGKEHDHRNPGYIEELKKFVNENDLNPYIRFLGFLPRNEQLSLMKSSLAIIQPSLFEGWSTVVEDAKSLNKYLLLSDIPVLREQIDYNCTFFNPYSSIELSNKMEFILLHGIKTENKDYTINITNFGLTFLSLLKQ
jgi:glycosyltransferase involved in cell wall biosynthesis